MKIKKPNTKDIIIFIETALIFFFIFHYWDEVKALIVNIFT